MQIGVGLSLPLLATRRSGGGAAPPVGTSFTVLSSSGTSYSPSRNVRSSGGTTYAVSGAVLSSNGTSYNPI